MWSAKGQPKCIIAVDGLNGLHQRAKCIKSGARKKRGKGEMMLLMVGLGLGLSPGRIPHSGNWKHSSAAPARDDPCNSIRENAGRSNSSRPSVIIEVVHLPGGSWRQWEVEFLYPFPGHTTAKSFASMQSWALLQLQKCHTQINEPLSWVLHRTGSWCGSMGLMDCCCHNNKQEVARKTPKSA